ncbi:hypothetical protein B0H67DRAFT_641768 [Lasiosphaeris hirsuta]|uniref:Uncharacterized protein n=1 Tax=Lasiosphaeris hirsuta TaxID=260670 RepID=A0AA40B0G6_9PEZI|nr:hypothetical protein B0H67DRAFT_641768 [Lasiosphaeris hirsuta]
MGQQQSRPVFDALLAKTHVQHALIQPDGVHNDAPTALATVVFLRGTPDQLNAVYESEITELRAWAPSPLSITDVDNRTRFLGDIRFQRAYMTYFSMEIAKFGGSSKALAMSHLLTGTKPLIYGLFAGLGRPLVFFSDAVELQTAIMVMQSLSLSAVDWADPIYEILTHPQLMMPAREVLSPEQIIGRVSYDGRLSGVMKSGPGFHQVSHIFSNAVAKAAVLEYVHQLDCRDPAQLGEQLSSLSMLLLCGTHKVGRPAFDFYLSCVPIWVNSLRVLLDSFQEERHRLLLTRGVWLLIVLCYITQLRPVVDPSLLQSGALPQEDCSWESIHADFRQRGILEGRYQDLQLLRAVRSFWELGKHYDRDGARYPKVAWKLITQWQSWTGLGGDREGSLNIRL